ncbi:ABC-2 family transporter protein [Candidatus Uhrbacteria bacterium]|nr:ABC-2 family transporter protein [Candidatus Uhrbacteria bacterium]
MLTFFVGKLLRMGIFFAFTVALFTHTQSIGGFGKGELLLFFAIMNAIDVIVQLFWRGLSHVHELIHAGALDTILTKPLSPLFWAAFHMFDLFDVTTLPVVGWMVWYALSSLSVQPSWEGWLAGGVLFLCGIVIAFAFNLMSAALGFWMESGYATWFLYRHFLASARIPPEFFPSLLRSVLLFVIPIFLIVAFPVRALLGELSPILVGVAIGLTLLWFSASVMVWNKAVRHYTSASS